MRVDGARSRLQLSGRNAVALRLDHDAVQPFLTEHLTTIKK
jgi:hypothetical protein